MSFTPITVRAANRVAAVRKRRIAGLLSCDAKIGSRAPSVNREIIRRLGGYGFRQYRHILWSSARRILSVVRIGTRQQVRGLGRKERARCRGATRTSEASNVGNTFRPEAWQMPNEREQRCEVDRLTGRFSTRRGRWNAALAFGARFSRLQGPTSSVVGKPQRRIPEEDNHQSCGSLPAAGRGRGG